MSTTPTVRLLPITPTVADVAADPAALAALCEASVDGVADVIASVVAQSEAHRARTGAPADWGGFLVVDDHARQVIGTCAYVGAPDAHGAVEIAYFTFPPYEGRGYGGAMAGALVDDAGARGVVRMVYAHTLPAANASTRILARQQFQQRGTAQDDEVGLVWRWERVLDAPPG
jgi:RimJ/RimL family protein N-acetyltransferase